MQSITSLMNGIFSIRKHFIRKLDINGLDNLIIASVFSLVKVNEYSELFNKIYTVKTQRKIIDSNQGLCDIFVFKQGDIKIGTVSVMYKGGNELEYKIRTIDAFIFNVFIDEKYRGKGYAKLMFQKLVSELKKRSITEVFLAVSVDNNSALNVYKKIGFQIYDNKIFIRTFRHNIPYCVL